MDSILELCKEQLVRPDRGGEPQLRIPVGRPESTALRSASAAQPTPQEPGQHSHHLRHAPVPPAAAHEQPGFPGVPRGLLQAFPSRDLIIFPVINVKLRQLLSFYRELRTHVKHFLGEALSMHDPGGR